MALLSMAAVSCTVKEVALEEAPTKVLTLGASVNQTKAAISDNGAFTWQAKDALSVVVGDDLVTFKLAEGAGQKTATFSAAVDPGKDFGNVAIYPAGAHKVAGADVTVNLPASYVFEEDNTNIPMVGAIDVDKVKFSAVGGVARFKAGIPVGAVKVVLVTDKKVTGDFAVADGKIAAGEGADEVAYTFNAVTAEKNMTFNFPLPVGEYNMTFKVLDENDATVAELKGSAPHEIKAADVLIFDELALEIPEVPSVLTRVWAKSYKIDASWDDDLAPARTDWNRNATICGEYIYIPVVNNKAIGIFDLQGNYVSTISDFNGTGTFTVDAITTLGDAVYASSCGGDSQWVNGDLTIYKLTGKDDTGKFTGFEIAASYARADMPAGVRFGDRMTSFGTDKEGVLIFVDYTGPSTGGDQCRSNLQFAVNNGVVNPVPVKAQFLVTNDKGSMQGIYILEGGPGELQFALYAGNQVDTRAVALNSWLGDSGWWNYEYAAGVYGQLPAFTTNVNDPRVFNANGKDYLAYVVAQSDGSTGVMAYLNVAEIPDGAGNILQRIGAIENIDAVSVKYGLVDPDDPSARAGAGGSNGTGYCAISYVGGEAYLMAGADVAGMSLFKIDGATIPVVEPDPEPENLAITPDGVGTIEGTTATIAFDRANYPTEPIKLTYTLDGTPVEKTISGVMHVTLKNVPKATKYVFFEIYPTDGTKFLFDKATADLSVETPALIGEGNDNAFIPVSLAADGDLEFNLPILTGSFNATNFKVELFTDGPWKWDKKVGLAKLEKPFAATTVKPGDVFDLVYEWEKPAGVTIDGNFIDWLYDDPAAAEWTLPEGAIFKNVEAMKLKADDEYAYMYLELVEVDNNVDWTPFDIFINSDGNNSTGCVITSLDQKTEDPYVYIPPFTNPGIEWYLEGTLNNGETSYADMTGLTWYLKYTGADGDNFWSSFANLNDDFKSHPEKIYAQGVIENGKGKLEIRFSREAFGITGDKAAFGIKVMDGQINWRTNGLAPQVAAEAAPTYTVTPELLYLNMTPIAAPEPISITVDGNMSDWANVEGVSSDGGPYYAFKAFSDGDNLYLYSKRDFRNTYWAGNGYFYYGIDEDNNAETAMSDTQGMPGVDEWVLIYPFGGSNDAPEIPTTPTKLCLNSWDAITAEANSVGGVIGTEFVEIETVISLSKLNVTKGSTVKIYSWGNKDAAQFKTTGITLTL